MNINLNSLHAGGSNVAMRVTHPQHYNVNGTHPKTEEVKEMDFYSLLSNNIKNSVESVNQTQVQADKLAIEMVTKPNEVSAHEVMIATEKAQLSINLTKALLNRAITAFQTITNLR